VPTVQIVIDMDGVSPGSPGVARVFDYLYITEPGLVTLSLGDTSGVTSYEWRIVDQPEGASATLSSVTAASPTFTPTAAKPGTYLVECIVNGGEAYGRNAIAFRTSKWGLRKPAAGETNQYDALKGWKPELSDTLDKFDGILIPPTVMALGEYETTGAVERIIGGGIFNGGNLPPGQVAYGMTPKFRLLGLAVDPGTTVVGEVRLYDRGPIAGPPVAGVLRSIGEIDTSKDNNKLLVVDETLIPVPSPSGTNEIHNTARMYEVRDYLSAGGGGIYMWILWVGIVVE
jgi:hypothetical protein